MIRIADQDGIRTLTLDRPDRMNAIPPEGWHQLHTSVSDFEASDQRVLVITGAGENFCAGADLITDRVSGGVTDHHQRMHEVGAVAAALIRSTKPTIAAVDGVAIGAGMNLALACDVVICTDQARFSEIFAKRGLTVDFGGTWLLPRIVGLQRAKELALSGRIVTAPEAARLGLCIEVVDRDALMEAVRRQAAGFLEGAPMAQLFIKQGLNRSFEMSLEEALNFEAQSQAICLSSRDAAEGVEAFREKRTPTWHGR